MEWSARTVCPLTARSQRATFTVAKRLECVQLAGAIVKRDRAESGSKLRALQTLRARERPHRTTMGHRTYVPECLASRAPMTGLVRQKKGGQEFILAAWFEDQSLV
jgi:hypothetical protein